jgi:hypothetical protein
MMSRYKRFLSRMERFSERPLSKGTDLPSGGTTQNVRYTVDNISSTVYINDFVVLYDGTTTEETSVVNRGFIRSG